MAEGRVPDDLKPCPLCGLRMVLRGDYTHDASWNWLEHDNREESECPLAEHTISVGPDFYTPAQDEADRWNTRIGTAESALAEMKKSKDVFYRGYVDENADCNSLHDQVERFEKELAAERTARQTAEGLLAEANAKIARLTATCDRKEWTDKAGEIWNVQPLGTSMMIFNAIIASRISGGAK